MTLNRRTAAYRQIQNQFNNAKAQVTGLHNELNNTRKELNLTKNDLQAIQSNYGSSLIKHNKPDFLLYFDLQRSSNQSGRNRDRWP